MPVTVNIHEAKTHLSRLLVRACQGEEVVISRAGQPIVRLVPVEDAPLKRTPGSARGRIALSEDFDDPLPEDLIQAFER